MSSVIFLNDTTKLSQEFAFYHDKKGRKEEEFDIIFCGHAFLVDYILFKLRQPSIC